MPPKGKGKAKEKVAPKEKKEKVITPEKAAYLEFAKKHSLFIRENFALFPNLKSGPSGKPNISNEGDHIQRLKPAFEPMGQGPLATFPKEWLAKRKELQSKEGYKKWPKGVVSFEVWATATAYDHNPKVKFGGPAFQNMLQFLLVDSGFSKPPEFDATLYCKNTGTRENRRGPNWYKYGTDDFKEGPHSVGINEKNKDNLAWYTPETQGAYDKLVGGGNGAGSNSTHPDYNINDHMTKWFNPVNGDGKPKQMFTVGAPTDIGTKHNWFYHCLGFPQLYDASQQGGGNNNSCGQFVTSGDKDQCNEAQRGITALGNLLAGVMGLYYYEGCEKPENNWTVTQKHNGQSYQIRMRMWNPRYKLVEAHPIPGKKNKVPLSGGRLLIREPVNSTYKSTKSSGQFVGSHFDVHKDHHSGFLLPAPFKMKLNAGDDEDDDTKKKKGSKKQTEKKNNSKAVLLINEPTPPQFLKQLVNKKGNASIGPWFGVEETAKTDHSDRGKATKGGIVASKENRLELMRTLHEALGDIVHLPEEGPDALRFGFKTPVAHWLFPMWQTDDTELTGVEMGNSKTKGTGYQPIPNWRKAEYIKESPEGEEPHVDWTRSNKIAEMINQHGLAVTMLDLQYNEEGKLFALNNIDYILGGEQGGKQASEGTSAAAEIEEEGNEGSDTSAFVDGDSESDGDGGGVQDPPPLPPETEETEEDREGQDPVVQDESLVQLDNQEALEKQATTNEDDPDIVKEPTVFTPATPLVLLTHTIGDVDVTLTTSDAEKKLMERIAKEEKAPMGGDMQPGATQRSGNRDLNQHFKSSLLQAWPHADIYNVDELKLETQLDPMSEAQLQEYRAQYGSTKNTYLRGEKIPKLITGITPRYGYAKDVIHTNLFTDNAVHMKHMCRMVAIYFENGEFGNKGSEFKISFADKQRGMLYGVYGDEKSGAIQYGWMGQSNFPPAGELKKMKAKEKHTHVQLWPPVFGVNTKNKAMGPTAALLITLSDINMHAGADEDKLVCTKAEFKNWFKQKRRQEEWATMSVLQWVTSPWHYVTLPYMKKRLLFDDGETYSEGCKRCSRPFHEYKHMYSWFPKSPEGTQHWQMGYWCVNGPGGCSTALAPKPFHHGALWTDPVGNPVTTTSETSVLDKPETPGWHNWPTRAFMFGYKPAQPGGKVKAKYPITRDEYDRREDNLPEEIGRLPRQGQSLLFKRYTNHMYHEHRLEFWGGKYPEYPQSRPSYRMSRLHTGMREYNLQRASKYGNLCFDCAAVLENAPGLLIRNYQKKVYQKGDFLPKMSKDDKLKGPDGNTYWSALLMNMGDEGLDRSLINFDHTHSRNHTAESIQRSMKKYLQYISSQQEMVLGRDGDLAPLTKFNAPPDIYIQKQVELKSGIIGQVDHEQLAEAVKALGKMKPITKEVNGKLVTKLPNWWTSPLKREERLATFALPAFQHMIFELERKYMHNSQFVKDKQTKVFDSDMVRVEERNVELQHNGITYKNCLRVRQYVPPKVNDKTKEVFAQPKAEVVYYYDKLNKKQMQANKKTELETMWRGDDYVQQTGGQGRPNRQLIQYRKMRQSRLFITYSLHRAVTSEDEARFIMMRMADAAHCLFGNDQNLAELLVFGYKVGAGADPNDSMGKGGFTQITAPKKKDQIPNFYGHDDGSSYLHDTYQTHVDSVDVDGGIEIGPQRHHPHFHILLTVNHYSYIQIDYFKMNAYLEMMFKGIDKLNKGWGDKFKLLDASGNLFYTDNENPYVDIKLYPQDNWNDIIAAYVRKNATPGPIEAARIRPPPPQ